MTQSGSSVLMLLAALAGGASCQQILGIESVALDGDGGVGQVDAGPQSSVTVEILDTPPALTNATSAEFAFAASGPVTSFQCRVDDESFTSCTSPHQRTDLPEGARVFAVRAIDEQELAGPAATNSWTIDLTAPVTKIDSGPSGEINTTSTSIAFSTTDGAAGAVFACSLNGEEFSSCTSPLALDELGDGTNEFRVKATDAAGNVNDTPTSITFDVTTGGPPGTTITSPKPPFTEHNVTITFTATKAQAFFSCSLDGVVLGPAECNSPFMRVGLAQGPHSFSVSAALNGQQDPTPATYQWTVTTPSP